MLRRLGYIGGLRTFLSLGNFELYLITFLKTFVAFRSDRAVVNEYIRTAVVSSDKAVALGVVKPLHRTFQTFHLRPLGHVLLQVRSYPAFEAIVLPEQDAVKGLRK
jgi:hypothetical protein